MAKKVRPSMANGTPRRHLYDAAAFALHAHLTLPIKHVIHPQAHSKLSADGGYVSQRLEKYRAEGVISFESARTHVAGNPDQKDGHAWATLTTSVVEHFNVMDIVTADRIVAQIHTYHPLEGYVPEVTFLGTRFENLCIAGHQVKVDLNLNQMGPKPASDGPYLSDAGFLDKVRDQRQRIWNPGTPPPEIQRRYPQTVPDPPRTLPRSIETSLVYQAKGDYPWQDFGHVIVVPGFGKIYLATLKVEEDKVPSPVPGNPKVPTTRVTLKMIEFEMGSNGAGDGSAGAAGNSGSTGP